MTPWERLEKWSHGHKARSVNVESPNGYGAGCWEVWLGHEHGVTVASEAQFWGYSKEKGGEATYRADAEKAGQVYPTEEQMDDGPNGWAGLAVTITTALDAFDRGVWGPRKPNLPLPEAQPIAAVVERFVREERAAVVAWLRDGAGLRGGEPAEEWDDLWVAARDIERGDHRREEER